MSNTNLILDSRRDLAQKHTEQLRLRRVKIAAKIQALHDALVEIIGKDSSGTETTELCNSQSLKAAKLAAIKLWLRTTGNSSLPITDSALLNGLVLPHEVISLLDKLKAAIGISEDPQRYFQDGSFKPLPVSLAEKELIFKRSEIAAHSLEDIELFRFLDLRCKLANRANAKSDYRGTVTEGNFLRGAENEINGRFIEVARHNEKGAFFRVKVAEFGSTAEFTPAFDEGTVSMD